MDLVERVRDVALFPCYFGMMTPTGGALPASMITKATTKNLFITSNYLRLADAFAG